MNGSVVLAVGAARTPPLPLNATTAEVEAAIAQALAATSPRAVGPFARALRSLARADGEPASEDALDPGRGEAEAAVRVQVTEAWPWDGAVDATADDAASGLGPATLA